MLDNEKISAAVDRMAEIKLQIADLKLEYDTYEAELLKQFSEDIESTKAKTITYKGLTAQVEATMADKVDITYPSILKKIFGIAYSDVVTEETTYKLKEPAKRMLAAIYNREFVKDMTLAKAIDELPCDTEAKKALVKKLKGANFETDRKNLMNIGGLEKDIASDYAFLIAEAANWEQFILLMQLNGITEESEIADIIKDIDGSVTAEKTPKIKLS